jgi:TIR domain
MTTEQSPSPESMLYVVHAAADRDLAILLRARIKDLEPGVQVFLASKAGEIPTGEDWLAHIHKNLKAATSFLLLTPRSVDRHWVWYEAGVAWSRGCRRLPVTAGGLDRATVHYPFQAAQILDLERPDDAAQLFRDLGAELESSEAFCRMVRATVLPPPGSPADLQRVRDALAQVTERRTRWLDTGAETAFHERLENYQRASSVRVVATTEA